MKKTLIWIIAIAVVVGFIALGQVGKQPETTQKRKVYAVLPLTGAWSGPALHMKKSIDLYFKMTPNPDLEVVYVDSEANPAKALTALMQASVDEENPLVLSTSAMITSAILPYVVSRDGFIVAPSTTRTEALAKSKSIQLVSQNTSNLSQKMARYMSTKYNRIAVVYSSDEYGVASSNWFKVEFLKDNKNKIMQDISYTSMDADMKTIAEKLIKSNPESIFITAVYSLPYINLFKEIRIRGYKGEIVTDAIFLSQGTHKQIGLVGSENITMLGLDAQLDEPLTSYGRQVKKLFLENGIEISYPSVMGMDAAEAIDVVLKKGLPLAQETFEKELGHVNNAVFLPNGSSTYDFVFMEIKDGKIIPIEGERK